MLSPTIKGLAYGENCWRSSNTVSFLMPLPFYYFLVRELPHFLGYDFSPLTIIPPFSALFCLATA
jgi:hypothetical protein